MARWLAERELTLTDLRTGSSLEEAYLAITGSSGTVEPAPDPRPVPPAGAAGGAGNERRALTRGGRATGGIRG